MIKKVVFVKIAGDEEVLDLSYTGSFIEPLKFKEDDIIEVGFNGSQWYMQTIVNDTVVDYELENFNINTAKSLVKKYKLGMSLRNWKMFKYPNVA
jgi:tRNA U34 5-carboxymethylaminomethyl modifying GTPase MnmE/TrmE